MKIFIDNLLTLVRGDDGRFERTYIRPLPNVKRFVVVPHSLDEFLAERGIEKTVMDSITIETGKNKRANRYLNHQIKRLNNLIFHPKMYGALCKLLNSRSKVGFIAHLNRIIPKGYRELPVWKVLKLRRKVLNLQKDFSFNIDFKRVYIPKGNDKWRPLGVPTLEWRIYLCMLNTQLGIFLQLALHKEQHAYIPGKGTLSAGRSVLSRISSENIYEFDLRGFFPSVQIEYVTKKLSELGMPKGWQYYIENGNKSKPKLPKDTKCDESDTQEAIDLAAGRVNREQKGYLPIKEFIKANGIEIGHQLLKEDVGGTTVYHEFEFVQLQHALFSSFNPVQKFGKVLSDLPQGGGISPILSILTLDKLFKYNPSAVMYADDGLIFEEPVFNSDMEGTGIQLAPEKSGGIKRNGKGLRDLKFLGVRYNPATGLVSATRNGTHFEVPTSKISELFPVDKSHYKTVSSDIGEQAIKSKLGGYIMAVIYNRTWNLKTSVLDWDLTSAHNSGINSKSCEFKKRKNHFKLSLFNSSTLASHGLMNKI